MTERVPDLTALRLLLDVRGSGSLGGAARCHGISQPAASKQIARLEGDLGLTLLHRSATGSSLTAEGRVIADWAGTVLDALDHLMGAAGSLREGVNSDLRVVSSMTIAEHLMPKWLFETRTKHPRLHVGLQVANSRRVQQLVLADDADVGFVEGPDIDERLNMHVVAIDRLVVVVAPDHPWAARSRPLDRGELMAAPLVVRESGSGTRMTAEGLLGSGHVEPLLELGSNEAVKGAVAAGAGPGILSTLAVDIELGQGRLTEIPVSGVDMSRRLNAVWPRGRELSEPSRWLLQAASERSVAG